MIFCRGRFRFIVKEDEDRSYYRFATGQRFAVLGRDDILYSEQNGELRPVGDPGEACIAIGSFKELKKKYRNKLWGTRLIAMAFWALLCWSSYTTSMKYFESGMVWYRFAILGIVAILTVAYTTQAINPVAHDTHDGWINLRTGSSNLNGGCKLLRKR